MKICIPSADDQGLESQVFEHFGRAPFFTLVETNNGKLEVMSNPDCHDGGHAQHRCHHSGQLKARGVDAVVSGGIGRGAYAGLKRAGIEVLIAGPGTVGDMVESVKNGNARRLDQEHACGGGQSGAGHGHRHGTGHGHGHGCSHGRS